ncbi:MAG: DNA mismatch repair protein MutS [Puniceicoccales bacterium]|jgi:DNA mismatch repair protein MutS|nr:DNA mismatch repair protein MutS [Puniceicoccales bacterium]
MQSADPDPLTPMMRQYWEIRRSLPPRTLLFFRLGDFYEMFGEDAEVGSRLLGITLTQRQTSPMAGIPFHAAETYIAKVLNGGYKVAICDQLESPQSGKLVRREITRILSPGTTIEDQHLEAGHNRFLAAFAVEKNGFRLAWLELSTGNFSLFTAQDFQSFLSVFQTLRATEVVLSERAEEDWEEFLDEKDLALLREAVRPILCSEISPYAFDGATGFVLLKEILGVAHLLGFGIPSEHPALGTAAALIRYARENLRQSPHNLYTLREYRIQDFLVLDKITQSHLEIFHSYAGKREGSLLRAMDRTRTSMGARLLESYFMTPPLRLEEIQRRQGLVSAFFEEERRTLSLQESLRTLCDIPRTLTRIQHRTTNPRELGAVRRSLRLFPEIAEQLSAFGSEKIQNLAGSFSGFEALESLLSRALREELPNNTSEGAFIREGYDASLDHLREITEHQQSWLQTLEAEEQRKTGIRHLRIRYNHHFGYFIEVTKAHLALVPPHYIRRQTTVGAERYTTEDLREKEREIFHARDEILRLEQRHFAELLEALEPYARALHGVAHVSAEVDLFCSWAVLARERRYGCPEVDSSDRLEIIEGRHPVVEQILSEDQTRSSAFIPNDTQLSSSAAQVALITGPNMAGKSTYIRQVALIAFMAHLGSWVPASRCRIGLLDRIFSRVGASDDLIHGHSTFMVEMLETANILHYASPRSLVILDEIGRGTSTYDGLSLAWSVAEYLHGGAEAGPKTLFATHYHELTALEHSLPRLKNYQVTVKEWREEILFLRQVVPGSADRSYGIQVARLAGLPAAVIARAQEILQELENGGTLLQHLLSQKRSRSSSRAPAPDSAEQLDWLSDHPDT